MSEAYIVNEILPVFWKVCIDLNENHVRKNTLELCQTLVKIQAINDNCITLEIDCNNVKKEYINEIVKFWSKNVGRNWISSLNDNSDIKKLNVSFKLSTIIPRDFNYM